ncbi:hypothetical protein POM88_014739 [Heracleum sosnowskyi]|uniref:Uncharacterized protein n=1 Tax=Heracleum sosnowskyi TaxID=360622 RepID=A0AAD8IKG0_9APIA|nr:hypothetical protein POM88_014739 [Heracleum sosnowskyi]
MTWFYVYKKQMGMRKTMACLSLVVLMLCHAQIATSCTHKEDDKTLKFEAAAAAAAPADSKLTSSSININGGFFVKVSPCYKEGDDIYVADQRRIKTGANPLHNR